MRHRRLAAQMMARIRLRSCDFRHEPKWGEQMETDAEIVASIRTASSISSGGPQDNHILAAVRAFVEVFDYWYIRVMKEAVKKYRTVIIQRINPFVRRIQYDSLDCAAFASRIVEDYNSRNFVTAGGWAIEGLPSALHPAFQKSAAHGIDLQRSDSASHEYHLYVIKSGMVTRNSDIVGALKRNSRAAEKLLRQSSPKVKVTANYVVAAGKTTSTFEDGVRRPSSAEFWAEVTGLPDDQAVGLVLAVVIEAGRLVKTDASEHVRALCVLVESYLSDDSEQPRVDWGFLKKRLFQPKAAWIAEDKHRHQRSLAALKASGYGEIGQIDTALPDDEGESSLPEEEDAT